VVGIDIRHHLLAYALLRGTPYAALEPRCRLDNLPQAKSILQIIQAHMPGHLLNEESVKQWFRGEEVQECYLQKSSSSPPKGFWKKLSQLFN